MLTLHGLLTTISNPWLSSKLTPTVYSSHPLFCSFDTKTKEKANQYPSTVSRCPSLLLSYMATVLESLTVTRSSPLLPRPVVAAFASPVLSPRRSLRLPDKLRFVPSLSCSFGSASRTSRLVHGTRIVCEAQDTAVEVPAVTDSTWQSLVIDSESPVLVEFWAPWCGPCRMIHPVIDELAKQYAGKLKCYKLNTDDCGPIATQYSVRSIPTVMIFKNGEKKDAIIGAVPKSTLTTSIEKFL